MNQSSQLLFGLWGTVILTIAALVAMYLSVRLIVPVALRVGEAMEDWADDHPRASRRILFAILAILALLAITAAVFNAAVAEELRLLQISAAFPVPGWAALHFQCVPFS